ncbi:MAG: hypothetical protein IJK28_12920 [Clostridia bacterium]|nr:hypothetical protein [Clostridia bacterium]
MKPTVLYRVLRGIVHIFTKPMKVEWEVPYDGRPAVFCPNHAGAFGPVAMLAYFDLWKSTRTWFHGATIHPKEVPNYVRHDYWWDPKSKLAWFYNITVPYLAALLLPPMVRSIQGIPVYYDTRVTSTFRKSVEVLKNGENLLIFPQLPDGHNSHARQLNPGFVTIAPLAYRRLGITLSFYPVFVDKPNHIIHVLAPVDFDPERPLEEENARLLDTLAELIHD